MKKSEIHKFFKLLGIERQLKDQPIEPSITDSSEQNDQSEMIFIRLNSNSIKENDKSNA